MESQAVQEAQAAQGGYEPLSELLPNRKDSFIEETEKVVAQVWEKARAERAKEKRLEEKAKVEREKLEIKLVNEPPSKKARLEVYEVPKRNLGYRPIVVLLIILLVGSGLGYVIKSVLDEKPAWWPSGSQLAKQEAQLRAILLEGITGKQYAKNPERS